MVNATNNLKMLTFNNVLTKFYYIERVLTLFVNEKIVATRLS